ncbi:DnaA regulatory inactivator Hda [Kushneria indalinina]|uniref:Regulatory inactivation of DnaA Hda protein n=1 Tax=Kushneria indalinina DSM 14324 TaxID=1122140 RepID=A0A3D9E0B3_9GAMM|nr:DnaA regulatory inactivator Hda [Kushneria indalinina]REC96483.1 regulatory inactivation of DnaA Hda protein [Kushneria indalinina DSM 14324]
MSPDTLQLPLGVGARDDATFASFWPGANASLVTHLRHQLDDGGEQFIYLWGASGSGRSHLLQAACLETSDRGARALYLPLDDLGHFPPHMLEDLEALDLIAIDDLERVIGRKRWEEALFHCFNRLRDANCRLVIAAQAAPRALPVVLPDLASRLGWGMTFHLQPLSDQDRLEVLRLRAHQRGMQLPDEVARYLLHRGPRRLGDMLALLTRLDSASLSAQRRLTIPFVKQALDW